VKWWSVLILEGYSRTILAGTIAPTEATWVALMVLYTACIPYGVPETLVSDSGGAYTSNDFEAVCARLQLRHETIESTKGESYQNLVETHFNIQRRLYDYQFSLTTTPLALEQRHQAFIYTYNTTAHQGLLKEQFTPLSHSRCWEPPKGGFTQSRSSAGSLTITSSHGQPISMDA
jgi:transposase InsO family protein